MAVRASGGMLNCCRGNWTPSFLRRIFRVAGISSGTIASVRASCNLRGTGWFAALLTRTLLRGSFRLVLSRGTREQRSQRLVGMFRKLRLSSARTSTVHRVISESLSLLFASAAQLTRANGPFHRRGTPVPNYSTASRRQRIREGRSRAAGTCQGKKGL